MGLAGSSSSADLAPEVADAFAAGETQQVIIHLATTTDAKRTLDRTTGAADQHRLDTVEESVTEAIHDLTAMMPSGDFAVVRAFRLQPALTALVSARGMAELMQVLADDFEGHERTRLLLVNRTPRYGNDDDAADDIMQQVFETYFEAIDGRPNAKGGRYRINLLPTTVHVSFGSVIGATADGRHAGKPLSEGISPVQGADRQGPTAVIKSASKMDHTRTGGTLLKQKFTPQLLKDEDGLEKLVKLVRTYFRLDGHHIQFNVVDAETLRKAQENPQDYRDLIVRVAGYSDYFCDLSDALQEEIITRTEHDAF